VPSSSTPLSIFQILPQVVKQCQEQTTRFLSSDNQLFIYITITPSGEDMRDFTAKLLEGVVFLVYFTTL
jgi:hypothetical protein